MTAVKKGAKGEEVQALQQLMNDALGINLVVDGDFGQKTHNCVVALQIANGIPANGEVGKDTIEALTKLVIEAQKAPTIVTEQNLVDICGMPLSRAKIFARPLNIALSRMGITDPKRLACFLPQALHESSEFSAMVENLNYSAPQMAKTWPSRYQVKGQPPGTPNALAMSLAKRPADIANTTYANREGNGDIASGHGYKYRGRGIFMLTFLNNYMRAMKVLGIDFVNYPEFAELPLPACLTACLFWNDNNLNQYADKLDFDGVSDRINIGRKTPAYGDAIGFKHRAHYFEICRKIFKV